MIDELKGTLNHAGEEEVKSLLFQTFFRIHMLEELDQYTEEQFVADLKKTYHDFLNVKRGQTKIKNSTNDKVVHILFDDSAAGSLKWVLKEMGLQDEEMVISFSDVFSIGPIWQLHNQAGLDYREEWLKNHLLLDDDYLDEYRHHFNRTLSMISAIPETASIIIWTGENAHEQIALSYVLYLLRDKRNDITAINTTKQYKKQFNIPEKDNYPLHTGEIMSEKLQLIYQNSSKTPALSKEQREKFEQKWQALAATQEALRIWENRDIKSVDESYYDDLIINKAKMLHQEQKNTEFILSARLIGEVICYLDQYISDVFVEYSVRRLILKGVFEIKGVPKAMRFYSVKLK
ncbi:DUF1835 domain-containing protein [Oceanobacillus sp. M60]|uniref:DUF1835 domain-containing protein n=1 Tax=Oceanobacillus oncorhynchi TaxID=545501 RepID=A0A0A1MF75_9BACI|nr:DUF1835 domain-containing protein [Oceanobacillus oncorhynchi]UUI40317.1 DUF1835 domain-containing protein [Oceanobacillus oncorhynchi]CEI81738.1 Protein of unknown function [Oceanobacillus oncorhynchi]